MLAVHPRVCLAHDRLTHEDSYRSALWFIDRNLREVAEALPHLLPRGVRVDVPLHHASDGPRVNARAFNAGLDGHSAGPGLSIGEPTPMERRWVTHALAPSVCTDVLANEGYVQDWRELPRSGSRTTVTENAVHHVGAVCERRPQFLPVDGLGDRSPGVAHQARDGLNRHPVGRHQRHEAVPQLPRRPAFDQSGLLGDRAETAPHVGRVQFTAIRQRNKATWSASAGRRKGRVG